MKNIAEYRLIGRVGAVKSFDNVHRISICANYRKPSGDGDTWVDDPHWNEVVVFHERVRKYIDKHISKGDLVHVNGRLRQNTYTDGETGEDRYSVDLIARSFSRLAKKQRNSGGSGDDQLEDDDLDDEIPY